MTSPRGSPAPYGDAMGSYSVERTTTVHAAPARVHGLVDDFHQWTRWSPWEDLDPELERTYSGPESGIGAHYAWTGNRKAGAGSMEITRSTPEQVVVDLHFLKPFKTSSTTQFELEPAGDSTVVTWRMTGEQTGLMAVFGRFMNMDKLIGPDFEKGLTRLKAAAER
jgi:Polyketide cyclase / dehydrase and lipid transport